MPYESGMDPIHDTRRRFDVRFYLLAIAFLVFDVELLFLYPWAVAAGQMATRNEVGGRKAEGEMRSMKTGISGQGSEVQSSALSVPLSPSAFGQCLRAVSRHFVFAGVMTFVVLLTIGFVYDWRKGVFQWR